MAKLSTIEIANKQRHVLLLGKVKENKALTRAELVELKRYERQAAGKKIAEAGMTAKVSTKKKKRNAAAASKRAKTKTKKKKAKKKRKARSPVDKAEVRRLGLECENLTEAEAVIRTRRSLAVLLKKYPELRQAWDRGRFLRNLRGLARVAVTISEAAKKLGFANGQDLRAIIDEDMEVNDLWKQTRLEVYIENRAALADEARGGNPVAIKAMEAFLLDEKEFPGFDPHHVKTSQLIEFTGETKQRISEWHTKFDLPRNSDNTFDLSIVWSWYKEFLIKKAPAGKGPAAELDPLRAARAEMIRVDLARRRNELLDRNEVVISQIAWVQSIKSFCERSNDELSRLCCNQPRVKIIEIHRRFFRELLAETAKYPKEFRLPAELGRQLVEIMQKLKPHDGER